MRNYLNFKVKKKKTKGQFFRSSKEGDFSLESSVDSRTGRGMPGGGRDYVDAMPLLRNRCWLPSTSHWLPDGQKMRGSQDHLSGIPVPAVRCGDMGHSNCRCHSCWLSALQRPISGFTKHPLPHEQNFEKCFELFKDRGPCGCHSQETSLLLTWAQ